MSVTNGILLLMFNFIVGSRVKCNINQLTQKTVSVEKKPSKTIVLKVAHGHP